MSDYFKQKAAITARKEKARAAAKESFLRKNPEYQTALAQHESLIAQINDPHASLDSVERLRVDLHAVITIIYDWNHKLEVYMDEQSEPFNHELEELQRQHSTDSEHQKAFEQSAQQKENKDTYVREQEDQAIEQEAEAQKEKSDFKKGFDQSAEEQRQANIEESNRKATEQVVKNESNRIRQKHRRRQRQR